MPAQEKPTATNHIPSIEEIAEIVGSMPEVTSIQERHPDWPKLDVSFYFAGHQSAKDMERMEPLLAKADVFLIEDPGMMYTKFLGKVSGGAGGSADKIVAAGKIGSRRMAGSYLEPIIRGLHGTGKVVSSIDLGASSEDRALDRETIEARQGILPRGVSYQEALGQFRDKMAQAASLQLRRESIMADNFEKEIERILDSRPELREGDSVNVLIQVGTIHTSLRHALLARGVESDSTFPAGTPHIFTHALELQRSFVFGKEPSPELVEKAFAELIVAQAVEMHVHGENINNADKDMYIRRYVSELSPEERSDLFGLWNNRMASTANIDALLVPAEMPPLATTASEIREANKLYEDRVKTLASAAVQSSGYMEI